MKIVILCLVLVLAGCQQVFIKTKDDLGIKNGEIVYGRYFRTDDVCYIAILKRTYPYCLKHELRHCRLGNWHPNEDINNDYC